MIGRVVLVGGVAIVIAAWIGVTVMLRQQRLSAQEYTDVCRLKEIVSLMREKFGNELPMDSSGSLDVYALVRGGWLPMERAVELFASARTGYGPSREDIERGDYRTFPYERLGKGGVAERDPLLADGTPVGKPAVRLAAYLSGDVRRE